MEIKYIFILVSLLIYFGILIISGFLAFSYSKKHKPFIEVRNKYFKEWKIKKSTININELMKPLKVKIELPIGEILHFLENEVIVYLVEKKQKAYKFFDKISDGKLTNYDDYFEDPDFISLKNNYRLKKSNLKEHKYKGMMYISNLRVLFENKGKYEQILINDILKSYISIIRVGDQYFPGYILHTDEKLYEVISNNPQVTIIINELISTKMKGDH
ncbi:hypothetical protein ESOMN_v1c03920 [Williamsoniiplasma somnilux]|uniref:Uncharacterized protein n=1 Tax=Williamsoniiplasma somnilux TaxID=215578 RepID=A0A2K8NYF2_9MOLU|nr:hypothetical protein [Williamsoniiplasma somnilux]ATZ18774.1 hypothetical protein ESOMN_v1c03920 [Williamsoniiplasma somnilux]